MLRGGVVKHAKYAERKVFSAGINLTHLCRGKIPYFWYLRRDLGVVNKMPRGLAVGSASPDEVYGGTREKPWIAGREQAYGHFLPALIANLEQHWNAAQRKL